MIDPGLQQSSVALAWTMPEFFAKGFSVLAALFEAVFILGASAAYMGTACPHGP
jgi:hypothetical protein